MGATSSVAAAHIKFTEHECRSLLGPVFLEEVFAAHRDSDRMISLQHLQAAYSERTDVFLTHDWGHDEHDNHMRVSKVNDALKARGLRTWFDTEKMEGNVRKKMISGIENTLCVAVFITKRYLEKVASDNTEDNCQLEFNFACRRKTAKRMLPVVMEARMRDTSRWTGEVGLALGGVLYVDLSAMEDAMDACMDALAARIIAVNGATLQSIWDNPALQDAIALKLSQLGELPEPSAAVLPAASAAAEDADLSAAMVSWFIQELRVSRPTAERFAKCLLEHDIGSIAKLTRRLGKDRHLLDGWAEFTSDDIDDILLLLAPEPKQDLQQLTLIMNLLQQLNLLAAATGDSSVLQMLIDLHALERVPAINRLLSYRDKEMTTLSIAAQCGHRKVVEILLQHPEINVNQRNQDCSTALSVATDSAIADLLRARGGVIDPAEDPLRRLDLLAVATTGDCKVLQELAELQALDKIYFINHRLKYKHRNWNNEMVSTPMLTATLLTCHRRSLL